MTKESERSDSVDHCTLVIDMDVAQRADAARKRFYGDGTVPYTPSDMPPKF